MGRRGRLDRLGKFPAPCTSLSFVLFFSFNRMDLHSGSLPLSLYAPVERESLPRGETNDSRDRDASRSVASASRDHNEVG